MTGYLERGETRSAAWADWFARFDFLLFVIAGLSHRFGLISSSEIFWVLGFIGSLAALTLLLAMMAFRRLWLYGDRGGKLATRATIVTLIVLAPFLYSGALVVKFPALNDVSTDLDDPPIFTELATARGVAMNPIDPIRIEEAEKQIAAFPEVTGRRYDAAPDTVLDAAGSLVNLRGWTIAVQPELTAETDEVTIELTARTFLLGFASDVAIRVTDEGETTYVDMRSSSHNGVHDLGSNARRIIAYLDDLDDEVANRVGR